MKIENMKKKSFTMLVILYVATIVQERLLKATKKKAKDEILRRLKANTPEVIAGWRLRKSWVKEYTGTRVVNQPARWELDIRRDTKPLSKAEKP